jgi:hypothetical protein
MYALVGLPVFICITYGLEVRRLLLLHQAEINEATSKGSQTNDATSPSPSTNAK